jgi:hypothetical protein
MGSGTAVSSSGIDDIAWLEAEMLGGGEEVFVVRVNLAEAVFLRADKVECV